MPKRDRRRDIIGAAEKLFTAGRFHEVTTDEIARAAKVGKGTIYKYFRDKDDLFFETANAGLAELCEKLHKKVPEGAPFSEQLLSACVAISVFFRHKRQLLRVIQPDESRGPFRGEFRERWSEKRKELVTAVAAIIAKGVDVGEIRGDVDPQVLAAFLLGMLRTRGRQLGDAPEAMQRYELVVDLFRNGAARKDL
jgi:AcrR family transcriptional regulator